MRELLAFEHRHDVAIPHSRERIRATAAARGRLLRRQPRVDLNLVRGCFAQREHVANGATSFSVDLSSAPPITGISPNVGSEDGGTLIEISGIGFTRSMEAYFGTPYSYVGVESCDGPTHCSVLNPRGTGTVHITITNLINGAPGLFSAPTSADLFTYKAFPSGDMAPDRARLPAAHWSMSLAKISAWYPAQRRSSSTSMAF